MHVNTWDTVTRAHEPQTENWASSFGGPGSRFATILNPSATYRSYDPDGTLGNSGQEDRAACTFCARCPRLCSCDKTRELLVPGSTFRSPSIRYDLSQSEEPNMHTDLVHENNRYQGTTMIWRPLTLDPTAAEAVSEEFRSSQSEDSPPVWKPVTTGSYGTAMTVSNRLVADVVEPMIPQNMVASQCFGPLYKIAGRGFKRTNNSQSQRWLTGPVILTCFHFSNKPGSCGVIGVESVLIKLSATVVLL